MENDLRVQRRRQEDAQVEAERHRYGPDDGAPCAVGLIFDPGDGSFPTTAGSVFPVKLVTVGGTQAVGATPTFTETGAQEQATNLGLAVPTPGDYVSMRLSPGGQYVFSAF